MHITHFIKVGSYIIIDNRVVNTDFLLEILFPIYTFIWYRYWTHQHTMQFLDSFRNWNPIMNTFILGQDVVLILLFMILLMSNNENIITVCLRESITFNRGMF
jgi:hypothetical protein